MKQYLSTLFTEVFETLKQQGTIAADTPARFTIDRTKDVRNGDFACNIAMVLSKVAKMRPRDLAEQVAALLPETAQIEKIEIAGPGFINFFLSNRALADYIESLENDPFLGAEQVGQGKTVVIDYSGPNVAKPMHIGHIRSTVIGNAIDRLYRFRGYNVIADNHLGDWGTQFGLMMIGFQNFVNEEALKAAPVEELERIYVESYNRSKEDAAWRERAKAELVKLQQGDAENRALWERFIELSIK